MINNVSKIQEKLISLNYLTFEESRILMEFILNQKLSETELFSIFNAFNTRKTLDRDYLSCSEIKGFLNYLSTKLSSNLEVISKTNSSVPTYYAVQSTYTSSYNQDLFISLLVAAYFNFKQEENKFVIYDKKIDYNLCKIDKINSLDSNIDYKALIISEKYLGIISDLEAIRTKYAGQSILDILLSVFKQYVSSYTLKKFFLVKDTFLIDYLKDLEDSNNFIVKTQSDLFEISANNKMIEYKNFSWVEESISIMPEILKTDLDFTKDYDTIIMQSFTKNYILNPIIDTEISLIINNAALVLSKIYGLGVSGAILDITNNIVLQNKLKEFIETGEIVL